MRRFLFNLRHLFDYLARRPVFELPYYREAELARLMNLFAHADLREWADLKVLEVGAGLGHIGDVFTHLGLDVTSSDGRPEHVERMKKRGRRAFVLDLDRDGLEKLEEFDLIIAFGVLYHLREPERFLMSCGRASRILLLESAVCDSSEAVVPLVPEQGTGWRGQDQALHRFGCRPSPAWVEETCRKAGFDEIRDISSPVANWEIGLFDWEPRDSGEWRRGKKNLRKMWIMERDPKD